MPLTNEQIENAKPIFLALLSDDGAVVGNKTLRSQLQTKTKKEQAVDLTDDDYWTIRNALVAEGKIRRGKGNGGSVAKTVVSAAPVKQPDDQQKYKDERSLYQPIHSIIASAWVKEYAIDDFVSQITASQGSRNTGGKWTRPDITLVALRSYPFIPGKTIEVITFEIKPWYYLGVEGVFETASHSAFAHRSYLMIHAPQTIEDLEPYERVARESERFGVGLVTFEDPANWDTYNIRLDAEHSAPDPSAMCEFISQQLTRENQGRIQRWK